MTGWDIEKHIEDFRDTIPNDSTQRFDKRLREEIDRQDLGEIKDELEQEYEQSEEHLELVEAAASGFYQGRQETNGNYEFAFTEPLEELNSNTIGEEGVKNGDVLLIKEDGSDVYLCIVECKSGRPKRKQWINELKSIEAAVEEYKGTLANQIGCNAGNIRHIEYTLLAKLSSVVQIDTTRLNNEIQNNQSFWGYETGEQSLQSVYGGVQDQDLREMVSDQLDAGTVMTPIGFTCSDHPLTQLKSLIERLIVTKKQEKDEHPYEFNTTEFRDQFREELQVGFGGDTLDNIVKKRTSHLLKIGKQINIFTSDRSRLNSTRDYRISFRGKTDRAAKSSAHEKYFETRSKLKQKERALDTIDDEFSIKQQRLTDFDSQNEKESSGQ